MQPTKKALKQAPCVDELMMGAKAKPIIPWIGGKRRLVAEILPWFEDHICYVEPFAGAAALLFNKVPSKVEVLNDVNDDLVNLYRVVQHHLDEFVRQFRWALTSRKLFEWAQAAHVDGLTDIQRAARFFYLQKLCFGAKVEGRTFGVGTTASQALNLLRIEEELSAAHLRLSTPTRRKLSSSSAKHSVARTNGPPIRSRMSPFDGAQKLASKDRGSI